MSKNNIVIRKIKSSDDAQIANVIRSVLIEFGVPKVGTAYEDTALDCMTQTYSKQTSVYYVVVKKGKIIGGAGIAPLDNYDGNVCELQKMYFLPEARGLGLGKLMIETCLDKAREMGFESCYLETLPYMKAATKLYGNMGFDSLEKPMGNTGHYSCNVWMLKKL
ncbi:MAG: GNAT family N-acetyltransferase [Flavobacteriaceae bacterium]|nr:GNAT family N-acetyltransferase [Mangrovimonas sp.]MCB0432425.1 GNAT family N-acetyltransferase [Mangrovimonas sp.]MCB0436173.1 GNAT family N-acetyltransferase [Mangrovimonas sp.]